MISAQAQGTLPKPITDPAISGPVMKTVWQTYTDTAEKYNDPGRFTAMIGGSDVHNSLTAYDQKRFGIKMFDDVPMKHQERAWTSPIWYTPQG